MEILRLPSRLPACRSLRMTVPRRSPTPRRHPERPERRQARRESKDLLRAPSPVRHRLRSRSRSRSRSRWWRPHSAAAAGAGTEAAAGSATASARGRPRSPRLRSRSRSRSRCWRPHSAAATAAGTESAAGAEAAAVVAARPRERRRVTDCRRVSPTRLRSRHPISDSQIPDPGQEYVEGISPASGARRSRIARTAADRGRTPSWRVLHSAHGVTSARPAEPIGTQPSRRHRCRPAAPHPTRTVSPSTASPAMP